MIHPCPVISDSYVQVKNCLECTDSRSSNTHREPQLQGKVTWFSEVPVEYRDLRNFARDLPGCVHFALYVPFPMPPHICQNVYAPKQLIM